MTKTNRATLAIAPTDLLPDIADALQLSPAHLHLSPIIHGEHKRNNVWRLKTPSHTFLLKQHLIPTPIGGGHFAPFQLECAVLSTLWNAGCPVPKVYWKSDEAQCLLLEWCGEKTLDAVAQTAPGEQVNPIIEETIKGFCELERAFVKYQDALEPYAFAPVSEGLQALFQQGRQTLRYFSQLHPRLADRFQGLDIESAWSASIDDIAATLGPLDYNARNIVVDGNRATFVDLGSIGWDWSEKRLVQYLSSLGANVPEGNFVNLLNREAVQRYVDNAITYRTGCSGEALIAAVDCQHVWFYLGVIHRLLRITARPMDAESQTLLRAWANPALRFQRAIDIITGTRLSEHHAVNTIRNFIGECYDLAG